MQTPCLSQSSLHHRQYNISPSRCPCVHCQLAYHACGWLEGSGVGTAVGQRRLAVSQAGSLHEGAPERGGGDLSMGLLAGLLWSPNPSCPAPCICLRKQLDPQYHPSLALPVKVLESFTFCSLYQKQLLFVFLQNKIQYPLCHATHCFQL